MTGPFKRTLRVLDVGGREPPHAPEAELSVVAAVFGRPDIRDELLAVVEPADFFDGRHRRVLEAVVALREAGQEIDTTSVRVWLRDRQQLENVGGTLYFAELLEVPLTMHALDHARTVAGKAHVRRVVEACYGVIVEAHEDSGDTDAFTTRAAQRISDALDRRSDDGLVLAYDALIARHVEWQKQWNGERSPQGLPTGLPELDELMGGLRPGALSVVAAVTGGGKSAFALQVARHVAGLDHNGEQIGAVYVSLEMPVDEVIDRVACSMIGISDDDLQRGSFTPAQFEGFNRMVDEIGRKPLWFYTSPTSVPVIRSLVRRAKREHERGSSDPTKPRRIGLVVVDYLGLMDRPDAERNDLAIGMITRGLKLLAMQLGVHVMLLAQFNRDPSKGTEPPRLADLKDSSSIEQDANLVFFLHRLWALLPDKTSDAARALKDCVEIVIPKVRKRGTGSVFARFDGEHFAFETPHAGDVQRWDDARPKPRARRSKR